MARHSLDILNASVSYGGILDLSDTSIALAVMALGTIHKRYLWYSSGSALNDTEWNNLNHDISLALDEIMGSLVGVVLPAVWSTASVFKFLPCDGSIYNAVDYPLLYGVLDSVYILSPTQFQVPDMRDNFPVGSGSTYAVGDSGGSASVALTTAEMPSHTHLSDYPVFTVDVKSVGTPTIESGGAATVPHVTTATGGGAAHENRPPFVAVQFFIVAG